MSLYNKVSIGLSLYLGRLRIQQIKYVNKGLFYFKSKFFHTSFIAISKSCDPQPNSLRFKVIKTSITPRAHCRGPSRHPWDQSALKLPFFRQFLSFLAYFGNLTSKKPIPVRLLGPVRLFNFRKEYPCTLIKPCARAAIRHSRVSSLWSVHF